MIDGTVNHRGEAVVRLLVRGAPGNEVEIETVIDSGFTGSMTFPASLVSLLGLTRQSAGGAVLADGTTRQFDLFAAEVEWDGIWKSILVSAIGDDPLIGMRLLTGYELKIAVITNGLVEITPLP